MRSSHFWYLFDLRGQKITLFVSLITVFMSQNSLAQGARYAPKHQEGYENKLVHYGFLFALPVTRFRFTHSDGFNADSTRLISAPATAGFRMGLVANLYLTDHWDLRVTPSVSLYDRVLEYQFTNGKSRRELREATWIELPILLKYKSKRRMNSRMYMIGGMTFGTETNVRRRSQPGSERLNTKSYDVTLDYGFGFEKFLAYTKFSPEVRFSHGLVNLFQGGDMPTSTSLRRLTTHTVTLYVMFE
ncbi:MAG: PorT family protein [Runella slithyformis]|nr:MAG: PorT family protein [Runella slithyformis]TAF96961.1 MAG: PorT family protein [Runella sp.]TAG21415.1 MAG: PorT family protein [Cytophagales bacterium]TAG40762.1 MAG: PorT family protein [Cytophagia bacterium]TAE98082.1 MAG: PorT family protein [Runella slithyformis]